MARDLIMNLFKLVIKWNDGDATTCYISEKDINAAELWAAWYVGSLGTFTIEDTEFVQFQDSTGAFIAPKNKQQQAQEYFDTHMCVSAINNKIHPEVGEYVDYW